MFAIFVANCKFAIFAKYAIFTKILMGTFGLVITYLLNLANSRYFFYWALFWT